MMNNKGIGLLVILSLMYCSSLSAQADNLKLNQIGIEHGLSQSTVFAIAQDNQGFMWFGTDDGLNRYDGYSVTVFKHNNLDSNSISDNSILSLLSDKRGDLWIGTRLGGVDRYVPGKNKFFHYHHIGNADSSINASTVNAIYEDGTGDVWLGTNKGLGKFNREKNSFSAFVINKGGNSRQSVLIRTICKDKDGNLWLGMSDGVYKIDISESNPKERIKRILLKDIYVYNLRVDHTGKIWISTYGDGLYSYDPVTDILDRHLSDSHPVAGRFISSVFEDSKKNLWIAAYDSGLSVFNLQTKEYRKVIDEPVMTLFQDKSNILWIGTFTDGVKMYDPLIEHFNHYFDNSAERGEKSKNLITSILEVDGKLWIGTYGSGIKLYSHPEAGEWKHRKIITTLRYDAHNQNAISSDRISALCGSGDGYVWAGTENDGLDCINERSGEIIHYKHNPKNVNSISSNRIVSLLYDAQTHLLWIGHLNGNIDCFNSTKKTFSHYTISPSVTAIYKNKNSDLWAGTFGGDLFKYHPGDDSFKKQKLDLSKKNIVKNGIYSIYEDKGIVWLGTHGSGLIRIDSQSDSMNNYTENNGLPNNSVYGILNDKDGNLWISTNRGLSKFNPRDATFRNYDAKDGLQSNEFNQGAYFAGSDGELFFGGVNGFNAFFPEKIEDNKFLPPVYITSFKIFDKVLPYTNPVTSDSNPITLSYYQNFFSFGFVALNYTSPEKNQYEYMLQGFDRDWHKVSAYQRYASYTNLDPGSYVLRVRASNNDGVWNQKGAAVDIIITPPFWMTWWFKSLIIIAFLIAAFIIYLRRKISINKEKELQKEISRRLMDNQEEDRRRIAGELHDSLGQGLLVIKNRAVLGLQKNLPGGLFEDLTEISETASATLKEVRQISHHLRPYELDRFGLTESLLSIIEKVESSSSISFSKDIENIDGLLRKESEITVYRIMQECLNNIVKHSDSATAGVSIQIKNKSIIISVKDYGKGFDSVLIRNSNKRGSGLDLLEEKARILEAAFSIETAPGAGTEIKIIIPFDGAEDGR